MKVQKVELHEFEGFGKRVIFDVARQSFYEIDSWTSRILALCDGRSTEDIVNQLCPEISEVEVRDILAELETAQMLVSEDVDISIPFYPPEKIELLHLNLQLSADHHPSCVQCYLVPAKKLPYFLKQRMPPRIAQQAVDLLMRESGKLDCYLTFSGVKTHSDCEWIRNIINYGNQTASQYGKKISFEVVIDSSLLVEELFFKTFANQKNLMITVNTRCSEEIQQMLTRYSAGISRALDGPELGLNIFVTEYLPSLNELIHQAIRVFLPQSLYVIPSVIVDNNSSATKSDVEGAKKLLRELCEYCLQYALKEGQTWIGHIGDQAENMFKRTKYYYYCGAGTRHLTVLPDGNLYPCAELSADTAFQMGNVKDGILKNQRRTWLQDYHVDNYETCASCWVRYLCGGGCRVDSLSNCGNPADINEVTCDLIRYSYELAMLMSLVYFNREGVPAEIRFDKD